MHIEQKPHLLSSPRYGVAVLSSPRYGAAVLSSNSPFILGLASVFTVNNSPVFTMLWHGCSAFTTLWRGCSVFKAFIFTNEDEGGQLRMDSFGGDGLWKVVMEMGVEMVRAAEDGRLW